MARSSFASPRRARTPRPDTAHPSQGARGPTVLPLLAPPLAQKRNALCSALVGLANAWARLDLRDELGWTQFAADAAGDIAQYLAQHAADVRAATLGRDGSASGISSEEEEESPSAIEGCRSADDLADTEMSANAESAADAAALAFLGVVDALAPADAVLDVIYAAAALGVIDIGSGPSDLGTAGTAGLDRRAS